MGLYFHIALFQWFQESANGEWFGWFQKAKHTLARLLQGMRSVLLLEFRSPVIRVCHHFICSVQGNISSESAYNCKSWNFAHWTLLIPCSFVVIHSQSELLAVGGAATGPLDASFCTNQRAQACKLRVLAILFCKSVVSNMAQGVESMWSVMKLHQISEHLCTNVQDLTETHQSARGLHLLLCWCAAFDSMILLSISCGSCKAAVNAMTQGYVPFVDSAELACGTLTAQCRAISGQIGWSLRGCSTLLELMQAPVHISESTKSIVYDDVYC